MKAPAVTNTTFVDRGKQNSNIFVKHGFVEAVRIKALAVTNTASVARGKQMEQRHIRKTRICRGGRHYSYRTY